MRDNKQNNTAELLEEYFKQSKIDSDADYNDEVRAEADLCSEFCGCLRVCCISLT